MTDFEVIGWPECQQYMDEEGWKENSTLIYPNKEMSIDSSTFLVDKRWLEQLEGSKDNTAKPLNINIEQMVENKSIETRKYMKNPNAGYYINGYRYGIVDTLRMLGIYE